MTISVVRNADKNRRLTPTLHKAAKTDKAVKLGEAAATVANIPTIASVVLNEILRTRHVELFS
jgi:hypothetical protein